MARFSYPMLPSKLCA